MYNISIGQSDRLLDKADFGTSQPCQPLRYNIASYRRHIQPEECREAEYKSRKWDKVMIDNNLPRRRKERTLFDHQSRWREKQAAE